MYWINHLKSLLLAAIDMRDIPPAVEIHVFSKDCGKPGPWEPRGGAMVGEGAPNSPPCTAEKSLALIQLDLTLA